jgi:hypothetical protein
MRRVVFKGRFLWFVFFAMLVGVWPVAAQASVVPASAADFAVLAGTALSCTDSNVTGQAGILTGAAVSPIRCNMNVIPADDAYNAFVDTYTAAGRLGPCGLTTLDATASGVTTLGAGTYCNTGAAGLTFTGRTLTLTGNGPWIFEIAAGFTATSLTVVSSNPCNVFWWVGADATATTSALQGTILAGSISFTDVALAGRAWATTAVTMTRTNIFGCNGAAPPSPANCTVAKQALATAKAQDIVEDAAEKTNPDKTADRAEDKAEQAIMNALNDAARTACARPVTPECVAARQALAANVAADRAEDRTEKAAEKAEKDSDKDKKSSDEDKKTDSDADKSEDKAEQAKTRALQKAVSAACGPGRHNDNDDDD